MSFDTTNSPCEATASEAVEAGLIVPMTWLMICRGHMQSFTFLALKLWICIDCIRTYRQLLQFEVYIVRWSKITVDIVNNLDLVNKILLILAMM